MPEEHYVSVSHWGCFPHDPMALERATDVIFLGLTGRSPKTKAKTFREISALTRKAIRAYQATPAEPKHIRDQA